MNFRLCCTTGTGSFLKRPNLRQNKFLMSYIPYAKVKSVSIITQTFPTFGRRSLSSITIKSQSGLVTRISKTECRLNVFHARKSQSQYNFTTCRPSLLAKEIKKGEQVFYNEIPPPPPKERSYVYPIFFLFCLSAGIYVLMTEDKEDIQEEILEAVKSKAEEITYKNQMEQIGQMQSKLDPDISRNDEGQQLYISGQSTFDNGSIGDTDALASEDSSDLSSKKEYGSGWYPGKYISKYLNRK